MPPKKEVLTSGDVARVLGCCSKTANKVMDSEGFPAFRVPGSRDRRVWTELFESWIGTQPREHRMMLLSRLERVAATQPKVKVKVKAHTERRAS